MAAACVYLISVNSSKAPAKKDWVKIRACIAKSAKILNDEAMKTYVLVDWDNATPELMDDRTKHYRDLMSKRLIETLNTGKSILSKACFQPSIL